MIESSYEILGLDRDASLNEIKLSYREKVKVLHPDFNDSESATDEFINLTVAYDVLYGFEKGHYSEFSFSDEIRDKYKRRARKLAGIKYNAFIKTKYFKQTEALNSVFVHFHFVSSILIIIGAPVLGAISNGVLGLFFGFLFVFITVKYWASIFTNEYRIDWKGLLMSLKLLVKTNAFKLIAGVGINLWLLFGYTLYSEIPTFVLLSILGGVELCGVGINLILMKKGINLGLLKLLLIWSPLVFNLFFLINYSITTEKYVEEYHFVHKKVDYSYLWDDEPRYEKVGLIYIDEYKYEDIHWYRSYFDFESMEKSYLVKYEFEKGLFGIRVLKNTELKP